MPPVSDSGKIVVEIDGQIDDLVADSKRVIRQLDEIKDHTKRMGDESIRHAQAMEKANQKVKFSITDFRSAYQIAMDVVRVGGQIWDATAGKTLEYADQVRLLGQINDQTAESNSRLIQTLDDYKISVDDITVASKKLKDNGLVPTVDTIADLAEEYQNIQDPAERLKFAQDNLGKSTKDWLEVLEQSPEVLRKQAAGISDNLILTQKMLDDARLQQIAQDSLNDSVQGLSITLGTKFIPVQKQVVDGFNVYIRGIEIAKERHIDLWRATDIAGQEIWQEQQAMLNMREAADESAESVEDLAESQKEAEAAAKSLSAIYTGLLSSMFSIQNANDSYAKTMDDLIQKDKDLAVEKDKLTLKMWEEQAAGKLTNDENLSYIQRLAEITAAQEENAQAIVDATDEQKKAAEQRVYDLTQQKLAADGVVTSGEYEYLQNLAVSYGLVSKAAADQAIAEEKRAEALASAFEQTLPPAERNLQVLSELAALSGTVVDFQVKYSSNVPGGVPDPQTQPGGYAAPYMDNGGSGVAGQPYMIGTPEVFVPNTGGEFIPLGGANGKSLGATYNVVINNPVVEKSENSIRRALKKLSYTGVAA